MYALVMSVFTIVELNKISIVKWQLLVIVHTMIKHKLYYVIPIVQKTGTALYHHNIVVIADIKFNVPFTVQL